MRKSRSGQGGVVLLEALIGLLIFSLGILALVAMQSVAISNVSNAKYRVEASLYADEIISQMWVDSGVQLKNVDAYKYPGGGATYLLQWVDRIQNRAGTALPGALTYPPTIQVIPSVIVVQPNPRVEQNVRQVIVTIRWKAPDALAPSNHVAIGWISEP
jgi:type IV pilus assembly protein PilV